MACTGSKGTGQTADLDPLLGAAHIPKQKNILRFLMSTEIIQSLK